MKPILFHFGVEPKLRQSLLRKIDAEPGELEFRHFPDGESYVRLMTSVDDRDVIFLGSLDDPDSKTLPLLFAADATRSQGARSVGLVAPYLPYMRQDKEFQPGEALTSVTYAGLISDNFDWLVTVDPHLHRHRRLDAIYAIPSIVAAAAEPIAQWIQGHVDRPCIIGPDVESAQWVERIATLANAPFAILRKTRHGDLDVEIDDPASAIPPDATLVLVDDIASSAQTMVKAVELLKARSQVDPICIIVHALFRDDAYQRLIDAGPAAILSTNTVKHFSNIIDVGDVIGAAATEAVQMAALRRAIH